jgi:Brp/Blh family beta-carotene 15,15'-monooxygenase
MSTTARPRFRGRSTPTRIRAIGGAAGKIKPSTGYSFQRNLEDPGSERVPESWSWRFRVYDLLLLGLIKNEGESLSRIFPMLFNRNSPSCIFGFLDEKSSFREELGIFLKLPWRPFLSQLILGFPFVFAFAGVALLPRSAGNALCVAGLLFAGIAHGSVDHLLDLEARDSRARFYLRYLAGISVFLGLMFVSPLIGLLTFLLLSADHFGECQFLGALSLSNQNPVLVWNSRIWGLFAVLYSPLLHWRDTSPIIAGILNRPVTELTLPLGFQYGSAFCLFAAALFSARRMDRYERSVLRRPAVGFASTLFLGATFSLLPLLQGFLCFFCFWHAWDSVQHQRSVKGWSGGDYLRKSLPYTALATLGAGGVLLYLNFSGRSQDAIWSAFFVLLGALTLPHARVMKRFYFR